MQDNIVATTQASPAPPPLHGAITNTDPLSVALGAIGGALAIFVSFRRRLSRDNTEVAKDRAETNLVQTLREERDKAMADAREAWDRRTKDAQAIAKLTTENEYLKRDMQRLEGEVQELKESIEILRNAYTRLAGAPPAPPPPIPALPPA